MNINCNYQKYPQNTAFKGNLRLVGDATESIKNAFYLNKAFRELAKGEYDIVGTIKSRNAASYEIYREGKDEVLFKFVLTAKKQVKGFWDRVSNLLNPKPAIKPTRNYHSEETTLRIISGYNDVDALKKELKI